MASTSHACTNCVYCHPKEGKTAFDCGPIEDPAFEGTTEGEKMEIPFTPTGAGKGCVYFIPITLDEGDDQ